MPDEIDPHSRTDAAPRFPRWGTMAGVFCLYVAAVLITTYPAVSTCRARLAVANLTDPLQHLWGLRWYRTCLRQGTSPFFCPDLQQPVGSPLGLYSPLHFQSLLFLVCSLFTENDVLIYNFILFFQFLLTGFGTFALTWYLTRHAVAATVSGLLVMLSGPMLTNAQAGGTELLALGSFPLFLVGWIRFVDRPSAGRLACASGLFLVVLLCSAYYGIMSAFPAALYVLMEAFSPGGRGPRAWLWPRLGWLAAFGLVAVVMVPIGLPTQIWAVAHGFPLSRSRAHFELFNVSLWNYVVPWPTNYLMSQVAPPFWKVCEFRLTTYLGIVTLGLLGYAGLTGLRFPRSRFLWLSFALLVILSLGASATIAGYRVPLPALWLWNVFPPFRTMRVPGRFGYFAIVCAAVIAGGALKHLLERTSLGRWRLGIVPGLIVLVIADLDMGPFQTQAIPPLPACYRTLLEIKPGASFYEVHSPESQLLHESTLAYWQALHGGGTSAGNPGVPNRPFERFVSATSPFSLGQLLNPGPLSTEAVFDLVPGARLEDYTWLFLSLNRFDYLVLHKWTWKQSPVPAVARRIRERLQHAIVHEDDGIVVFDRARLTRPIQPVILCREGWRERVLLRGRVLGMVGETAEAVVYNPTPDRPLSLCIEGASYQKPRLVRVSARGRELACWRVRPTELATYVSPPFELPEGLQTLTIRGDGSERPTRAVSDLVDGDLPNLSLLVASIKVGHAAIARAVPPDQDEGTRK